MSHEVNRRRFIESAAVISGAAGLSRVWGSESAADPEPLHPMGEGQTLHPERVVWVHDPLVTDWKGPGDGLIGTSS